MPETPPTQLVVGRPSHGVAEYAADLAAAVRRRVPETVIEVVESPEEAEGVAARHGRVHLHVTDGLLGTSPEAAAERVRRLADATRLSLTLHDLPQESDGERNLPRRAAAYASMVAGVCGVAVSSRHEAALVREHLDPALDAVVVPLGTRVAEAPSSPSGLAGFSGLAGLSAVPHSDPGALVVLVAGYVYPGKGHAEVVDAVAGLERAPGASVEVVALGGVSTGHDAEAAELGRRATAHGVGFRVTGYLDPEEYRRLCRSPGVPVVAHRHYSASRSLLDWAEQGRRPVVLDSRYTREMAALRPGTLHLTALDDLGAAIEARRQDPRSTVLPPGHPIGPTLDDAARSSLAWWETLPW